MNFIELCSLLILDEKKGKTFTSLGMYDDLVMPCAIFFELLLLHKIRVENNRVIVSDSSSTGNKFLDMALKIIVESKKERKIFIWIQNFTVYSYQIVYSIYEKLELDGILQSSPQKKRSLYFIKDPSIKQRMLEEIEQTVVGNIKPNIYQHLIILLIKMTYLYRAYVLKGNRKQAKTKYNEYLQRASVTEFDNEKLEYLNIIVNALKANLDRRRR